jgi:hypothetical protein
LTLVDTPRAGSDHYEIPGGFENGFRTEPLPELDVEFAAGRTALQ